jgi:CheY-like chemotaxis protein
LTYTILIVDDSKIARMSIVKALNSLHPDWKRVEATNAAEALDRATEFSPEVVLVDFNMPGKDGVTLAAELLARNPRTGIAVISANSQASVIDRTEAAGATFLRKPLAESALAEFLTSAIMRRAAASQ